MLLNLGLMPQQQQLTSPDSSVQAATPPAPVFAFRCSATSLSVLLFLGACYNRFKQIDASIPWSPTLFNVAMSPSAASPSEGKISLTVPTTLAMPHASSDSVTDRKLSRTKTLYRFAHPVAHARHKRLKLRPKLLLQLQQISQTPRPLPILDILPSTLGLPRLSRKFPTVFRGRNNLGPNDLIVVMSELYKRTATTTLEKQTSSEDEDEKNQREVVATICEMLQEDARLKGKAEICLNLGPVWEATPLPSGSYEFVAHTDHGVRIMRWALRGGRNRRSSAPLGPQPQDDTKRFTFSAIDPNTRRHPVIASMTRNQLEVFDQYSPVARSTAGPATPSSGMSVVSDISDTETPVDGNSRMITLDDGLRTLIIVTAIWVAFREGWSQNFSYGNFVASPAGKPLASPTYSRYDSPTTAQIGRDGLIDSDKLRPMKDVSDDRRCMSISSARRVHTVSHSDRSKGLGGLAKRSHSAGAAFMERAKQKNASGTGNRTNRHSMFTGPSENRRDTVISRPLSLRQNSIESDDIPQYPRWPSPRPPSGPAAQTTMQKANRISQPNQDLDSYSTHDNGLRSGSSCDVKALDSVKTNVAKGRRRHRFRSIFTIFHRRAEAH